MARSPWVTSPVRFSVPGLLSVLALRGSASRVSRGPFSSLTLKGPRRQDAAMNRTERQRLAAQRSAISPGI